MFIQCCMSCTNTLCQHCAPPTGVFDKGVNNCALDKEPKWRTSQILVLPVTCQICACLMKRRSHNCRTWPLDVPNDTVTSTSRVFMSSMWRAVRTQQESASIQTQEVSCTCSTLQTDSRWATDNTVPWRGKYQEATYQPWERVWTNYQIWRQERRRSQYTVTHYTVTQYTVTAHYTVTQYSNTAHYTVTSHSNTAHSNTVHSNITQ